METGTTTTSEKTLKEDLEQASQERIKTMYRDSSDASSGSTIPTFQPTFEKAVNQDLNTSFPDPPPFHHHHDTPPPVISQPYIPSRWRQGIALPLPIALLIFLILLLETCIITFYTAVALYSTLPAAGLPHQSRMCNAAPAPPVNVYVGNTDRAPAPGTQSPSSASAVVVTVTASPTSTFTSPPGLTPSIVLSTVFSTKEVGASTTGV